MWRFPVFDGVRKGWLEFLFIEGEPAEFRADSLFLELSRAPDQGCSRHTEQGRSPVILQEERSDDEQQAKSHDVRPPEQAEITFATDDPDEAESDNEEGSDAENETKIVHSFDRGRWTVDGGWRSTVYGLPSG